jgi:chromosome segregation ATPase
VLRINPELTKMADMDKTFKLRAFTDAAKNDVEKSNVADENKAQQLARKDALLLAEERSKSLDLLKTIVQLRESLKQEQAKTAELQARLNKLDEVEESQLVKKNIQLEDEKKKSLEYMRMIEQLRESTRQEQEKSTEMVRKMAEQQAQLNKLSTVEESQLARKNAQLEEEKQKLIEYMKMIEQLRENVRQDQEKKIEMANKLAVLETKVKELSVVLAKISSLATGGKLDSIG